MAKKNKIDAFAKDEAFHQRNKDALPLLIHFKTGTPIDAFIQFYKENEQLLDNSLLGTGAILFRGLAIDGAVAFHKTVEAISSDFFPLINKAWPQTQLLPNVYTARECDSSKSIYPHNEWSHSRHYPSKVFLCCLQRSDTGGETMLADGRKILATMDRDIIEEIERKGLTYTHRFPKEGKGRSLSWQDSFEANSKKQLEAYCNKHAINYEWKEDGQILISQTAKGIIRHPKTQEKVWFNQIDQFYAYEETSPRQVTFGDDSLISDALVQKIRQTIDQVTVVKPWSSGDLLMLDNGLIAHGRKPYNGKRGVLLISSTHNQNR